MVPWKGSAAREVILRDLQPGGFLHGKDEMTAKDVWPNYQERDEFKNVEFTQFRDRLRDHRKQYKQQQDTNGAAPKKKTFKWINSAAKQILLEDLQPPHGILFGRDDVSAEFLWRFYENKPGFENVLFPQFRDRLKAHRSQMHGDGS